MTNYDAATGRKYTNYTIHHASGSSYLKYEFTYNNKSTQSYFYDASSYVLSYYKYDAEVSYYTVSYAM